MSTSAMLAVALAASMPAAPEAPAPAFHPGIGFAVAQQQRQADHPAETAGPEAAPEPSSETQSAQLAPRLPPPRSDIGRIQGSPRARGLHAAAAIAVQMAMLVAGTIAVRDQRGRARAARRGRAPPYRPYR